MQQPLRAWQIDRNLRLNAVPLDRRKNPSQWYTSETEFPHGDDLIALFWKAVVPGSGAPEIPYVEMVQSMANKGYEMNLAEELLPEGMALAEEGKKDELRVLTAELLDRLHNAPENPNSRYWSFNHPGDWESVCSEMISNGTQNYSGARDNLDEKIHQGWIGQLAGGAFGTALEGYHSERLYEVYGDIDEYVTEPETTNDDVVYELAFLDAMGKKGADVDSKSIALEWVRQIPFGWSAEWVALHNLNDGIFPPLSGAWRNPYSDWIGAQMRGMVCGMVAPGLPMEAARLAYQDGMISHSANGIYGEIFAATLMSLAFTGFQVRDLLVEAAQFLPKRSEYAAVVNECLEVVRGEANPLDAWKNLDVRFEQYNWIHAYPNIAADIFALWYGDGDFTASFRLLARAGLDVDCNAGLVGNILGVLYGVPQKWAQPIGDKLETYIRGKEELSIKELSIKTVNLAKMVLARFPEPRGRRRMIKF